MTLDLSILYAAERAKIADTARQQAAEAERLKLADKDNVIPHTAMLYGGIQAIAGCEALPKIATLQLPGAAGEA